VYGPDGNYWFTRSGGVGRFTNTPDSAVSTEGPKQTEQYSIGVSTIAPQRSNVTVEIPFDVMESTDAGTGDPGECVCGESESSDAADDDFPDLELVLTGGSVDVKPIIQVTVHSDAGNSVPSQIVATLTFDGDAESPVTFSTGGHSAGDTYLLAFQVSSAVSATGYYPWSVDIALTYAGGEVINRTVEGNLPVVVNDPG